MNYIKKQRESGETLISRLRLLISQEEAGTIAYRPDPGVNYDQK